MNHLTKAGTTSFYFYTSESDFYFRMNAERMLISYAFSGTRVKKKALQIS